MDSSIDQPLLRNCACRGDAGWAHVACLAEFAASKTTEAQAQREQDPSIHISSSFWNDCSLCKTPYMQYMKVAMAEAYVKQYKHLPDTNELRFSSLYSLASSRWHAGDNDGAFELYDRLQQLCDVWTTEGVDVRREQAHISGMMAKVFINKRKFNDALSTFKRRELYVAAFGPNSTQVRENNEMIALMKKRIRIDECGYQKADTVEELIRARELFRESQECVTIRNKLFIHMRLVQALRDDGRHQEAMEQLKQLLAESRQSLGPNHPDTLDFENRANYFRRGMLQFETPSASDSSAAAVSQKKDVWAVIECEQQSAISGQRVQVLRATRDAQKYICLIKNHNGVSSKFKVTHNQCILETGTTVVVHGLVSSADLNGSIGIIRLFDKEKQRYAVSVGKKKTTVSIKPINLNVVFA